MLVLGIAKEGHIMTFDKTLITEGNWMLAERTTWNDSATKSRKTYRISLDGGDTFHSVPRIEAMSYITARTN